MPRRPHQAVGTRHVDAETETAGGDRRRGPAGGRRAKVEEVRYGARYSEPRLSVFGKGPIFPQIFSPLMAF